MQLKTIASIQARISSSRLPGKVLKEICGKPMLLWHVERIKRSRLIDDVIIATTSNPADDIIVDFCKKNNINYYRGSENDVLNRITSLIIDNKIDIHVELFGDSPLTDPHIIDEVLGFFLKNNNNYDFVSNSIMTTYPPGQEVLVYNGDVLKDVEAKIPKDDPLREHVSIHITKENSGYKICNLEAPKYYNYPEIYLEVDTKEDFYMISQIIKHFHERDMNHFSLAQILDFLKLNSDLSKSNSDVPRRWKEFRKDNV